MLEEAADVVESYLAEIRVVAFLVEEGWPSFRDWCVCMPLPLSLKRGLGMNVTVLPCLRATFRITYL